MKRRVFIAGAAAVLGTRGAVGQQSEKVAKIGFLSPAPASDARDKALREGLSELGYIAGKNILIEGRFADGKFERLPRLAVELVELKVDVIVASVTQASLAAMHATKTIPIVMQGVSDPIGSGLVASLARPGGNVTGTSGMSAEVVGKSLELLKELVSKLKRVAVLWNPDNAVFQGQMLREAQTVAGALGVELQIFGAKAVGDLDGTFAAIDKEHPDAMLVLADPILALHRVQIVEFAEKSRLPVMYGNRDNVVSGGLISYGPNYDELYRRAANYVDKILKGAKPADLPVEQSTRFPLVLNLRTARALGIIVPATLLARADEVIE